METPDLPELIVLYSDVMQSGKSTVANQLVADYGYTRLSFADPVKDMVGSLLSATGMSSADIHECLHGSLKETTIPGMGVSPRRLMQTLGTEWRDSVDLFLWTDIVRKKIATLDKDARVVIDDMRFPHEYDEMDEEGAEFWHISRDAAKVRRLEHPSEGLLTNCRFDFRIANNHDLNHLAYTVTSVLEGNS